jgi:hypothetical protein
MLAADGKIDVTFNPFQASPDIVQEIAASAGGEDFLRLQNMISEKLRSGTHVRERTGKVSFGAEVNLLPVLPSSASSSPQLDNKRKENSLLLLQ